MLLVIIFGIAEKVFFAARSTDFFISCDEEVGCCQIILQAREGYSGKFYLTPFPLLEPACRRQGERVK
jgi:hypothetical protein